MLPECSYRAGYMACQAAATENSIEGQFLDQVQVWVGSSAGQFGLRSCVRPQLHGHLDRQTHMQLWLTNAKKQILDQVKDLDLLRLTNQSRPLTGQGQQACSRSPLTWSLSLIFTAWEQDLLIPKPAFDSVAALETEWHQALTGRLYQ